MKHEIPEGFTPNSPEEKYVYIMVPVSLLQKVAPVEALIASLIYTLQQNKGGTCYASNDYLSRKLGLHETSVTKAIARLKKKKILEIIKFDGRKRFMQITIDIFRPVSIGDSPVYKKDYKNPIPKGIEVCKKPQTDEVLCGSKYYLKSRRYTDEQQKVIDHWCSKGKPFSKPMKIKSILKPLKSILNKQNTLQINQTINTGFDYLTSEDFKFPNRSFSFGAFLTSVLPINGTDAEAFKQALPGKHKLSWYNLFRLKDDTWLTEHLYRELSTSQKDKYYELIIKNILTGTLSYKKDLMVLRGARKMKQWAELNGIPFITMQHDFPAFLGDKYADITKLKAYYLGSDDFWNEQFSDWVVYFGRRKANQIERI
jgi:DNA-binding Lrp family transcriptional regulator